MEIRRYAMGIATNSIILWMKPEKLTETKQRNKTMIRKSIIINYNKTFLGIFFKDFMGLSQCPKALDTIQVQYNEI